MVKLQAGNEKLLKRSHDGTRKNSKRGQGIERFYRTGCENVAVIEANKVMEEAKSAIARERVEAVNEMKSVISSFSIEIAEKILKEHLSDSKKQKDLVANYLENIKLN